VAPSLPELSSGGPEALPRPYGVAPAGRRSDPLGASAALLPGLSIVLPCFNESENLPDMVQDATVAAERVSAEYEIVIVDDGSRDGTAAVAAALEDVYEGIRLVIHLTNRGYGAAVRTGIAASSMPYVLLTDADLQFDLAEVERFIPALDQADVVVGFRISRSDPAGRRAAAAAWNRLVRALYGLPFQDVDCAFKLFPRDLLRGMELRSTGAMFSTELLVKTLGEGARVSEVGVHHYPRVSGRPSGGNPRVVGRAFRELARLHGSLHKLAAKPR
jgi:glycosyltransferase involved in cell wall biosynthesis